MLISKIKLDNLSLNHLSDMLIDDVFLINIFNEGICITQNINNISNLSIFINRNDTVNYFNASEISFVTDDTAVEDIDPIRVQKKLDVGLDAVLAAEGKPPLRVADSD